MFEPISYGPYMMVLICEDLEAWKHINRLTKKLICNIFKIIRIFVDWLRCYCWIWIIGWVYSLEYFGYVITYVTYLMSVVRVAYVFLPERYSSIIPESRECGWSGIASHLAGQFSELRNCKMPLRELQYSAPHLQRDSPTIITSTESIHQRKAFYT